MPVAARPVLERLADKFTVGDGCWEWTASITPFGYGQFYMNGKPRRAHRVVYEIMVGPIPVDRELDHLCRNRACVRPDHLEPVTRRENIVRGDAPQKVHEFFKAQTHCIHGHEYTPENTAVSSRKGWRTRRCRTCSRERDRLRRERKQD